MRSIGINNLSRPYYDRVRGVKSRMRDLSLHLMDIIQNSVSAGSTKITVSVHAIKDLDELSVTITDNGRGMDEETLQQVDDPFFTTRTTRKVGMGISLFKASAQRASGDLVVQSYEGKGTTVRAFVKISHIDRLPLGDVAGTFESLIMASPEIEFELLLSSGSEEFAFNSFEVKEKLGEVPITRFEVLEWIREYIDGGIKVIFGGVLNEVVS